MVASKSITAATARKRVGLDRPDFRFLIKPEESGKIHAEVLVFRCEESFLRYVSTTKYGKRISDGPPPLALTERHLRAVGGKFATVSTYLSAASDNTISHEIFHVTMEWTRTKRMDSREFSTWDTELHERVAEAHGYMVAQFWYRFQIKARGRARRAGLCD